MDKLDEINDEIKQDILLTRDMDLKKASLDIPYLHHKYLMKYEAQQMVVALMKSRKDRRYHETKLYYSGKADPDVYRDRPLNHTILKTDLDSWIKADDVYIHACEQLTYAETVLDLYKRTVDIIPNRSFYINNYIDLLKFENGER